MDKDKIEVIPDLINIQKAEIIELEYDKGILIVKKIKCDICEGYNLDELTLKKFTTIESMLNSYISSIYRKDVIIALFIFRLMFESKEKYLNVKLMVPNKNTLWIGIFKYLENLIIKNKKDWYITKEKAAECIEFSNGDMIRTLNWYPCNKETIRGFDEENCILFYGIIEPEKDSELHRELIMRGILTASQLYFIEHDKTMNIKFRIINREKLMEKMKKDVRILTYDELFGK